MARWLPVSFGLRLEDDGRLVCHSPRVQIQRPHGVELGDDHLYSLTVGDREVACHGRVVRLDEHSMVVEVEP